MIYLLLSIVCATSLVVCFRYFERWKIDTTFAIVYNYIVCVLTGLVFVGDFSVFAQLPAWSGFPYTVGLGVLFYLIFVLVGRNTLLSGVVSTSIAMKLSFVIPVGLAVLLYGDTLTVQKIAGIMCAAVSVFLIAWEKESPHGEGKGWMKVMLPFLIFLGSGMCDASFNFIQKRHSVPGWDHPITILVFFSAMLSGWVVNIRRAGIFHWKNAAAGVMLGIPNYFSLYFLLKTLSTLNWQSSVIFPVNNLGIVCLSAFVGFVLFRETLNLRKIIGFILAVASILIIAFL